ncbi:hypothetical protein N7462_010870 [Penicillium macrosclerotiorum]|uniref:uncharacterized protein n=1 Tax=Penicillium macrosclerotiorum TaxID=303699 RepID=UPI002547A6D1|nr:uncharacterized protein N7462_010870 [Penicillium macrosclerotiorum]KAJ5669800.1 hypothetical protein N7462_010870 [Penicillium macrosclerotiorum]
MDPPLPSLTSVWHNGAYPAISPSRPELSAAGKTVIITGAGSGIGRAAAQAFDSAGAARIVLIGRNKENLEATKATLKCHTSIHSADVRDEKAITSLAAMTGTWDVMILGAAYISELVSIKESFVDDWWRTLEVNLKGIMITSHAFLPTANPTHAAIVGFTSAAAFTAARPSNLSSYVTSKLAIIKFIEFLAVENTNLFAAAMHPGFIETSTFNDSGADASQLPMDSIEMPANFLVWLTSPEGSFLNGRSVWANWDVDELKAKAEDIQSGNLLTSGVHGWPFTP